MQKFIFVWLVGMVSTLGINNLIIAKGKTLKLAVITPDGSTWTNTLKKFNTELAEKTKGQVKIRVYAGGIAGDEADVLRKMRAGQIHAAGFSGVGLGMILPMARLLESPLLFKNEAELDHVKAESFAYFYQRFAKQGYVLLGFAEAGFVYLFSKQQITYQNLKQLNMWVWKGDFVAETFLKAFGMKTQPLNLVDVNYGLERGVIDSFYSPPLAAIAFQWYPKVKYMLDFPVVNSMGALIIRKATFDKLTPENQGILQTLALKYSKILVERTREDNLVALKKIKEAGIVFLKPTPADILAYQKFAAVAVKQNLDSVFSAADYAYVTGLLEKFRKNNK